VKLDSTFAVIEQRMWDQTSNSFMTVGSGVFNNVVFYVFSGIYKTSSTSSTLIFRGLKNDVNVFEVPLLTSA